MRVELINIGSELLVGRVTNTHQRWLCRELADLGYRVSRQVAVADEGSAIRAAVEHAFSVAELVVVTGGLGPTGDDLTRECIAELLGRRLVENVEVLQQIERFFSSRGRPMPLRTRVQALVPEGAVVLANRHGTAPGLVLEVDGSTGSEAATSEGRRVLILLPGPPRELQPMFTEEVVPIIKARFPVEGGFSCQTIKTTGMGESVVEETLVGSFEGLAAQGLEVGYCARVGEVDIRFSAHGERSSELVNQATSLVQGLLGSLVIGMENDSLERVVVQLLEERRQTLALAESCTGGFVANRLTNIPGASRVFPGGVVSYSNAAKEAFLGVAPETLRVHGAVSAAVAGEMAEGIRRGTGADYGLSVTGVAGPTGGSEEKPVGTVWMALACGEPGVETVTKRSLNVYERETFKFVTAQQVLDLLRRRLLSERMDRVDRVD